MKNTTLKIGVQIGGFKNWFTPKFEIGKNDEVKIIGETEKAWKLEFEDYNYNYKNYGIGLPTFQKYIFWAPKTATLTIEEFKIEKEIEAKNEKMRFENYNSKKQILIDKLKKAGAKNISIRSKMYKLQNLKEELGVF